MYVIFPAEELINISLGVSPSENKSVTFNKRVMAGEVTLKELTHPALNEALKTHNSVTFKLVRTVSDFTQQLSQIYEQHAEELQHLVEGFRKKNAELRKERPACPSTVFHAWETLLQEVEIDSQAHSDIASILGRQVSRPLLERSFYRKIQSRKVFTHRESYDTILHKTEDMLTKCRQDYKAAFLAYMSSPSNAALASYFDAHNAYVQQLHATNGMLEEYSQQILPQLMQELEEVYSDLCAMLADSVLQGAEIISTRAVEQGRRYDGLSALCRGVSGPQDLAHFVRSLQAPPPTNNKHNFSPPQPPQLPTPSADEGGEAAASSSNASNTAPILRNELTLERLASIHPIRPRFDALKKEANDLETQIKQLTDALDNLLRMQQRSVESSLFNKANELQEDISLKRFDLRVAQIHLSAVKAQKELFAAKVESGADTSRERKMSSSSTGSMKSKWLKAFKSLKTTSGGAAAAPKEPEKKAGTPEQGSSSDEKKISPSTSASSSGSVTKKPPIRPGHSKISSKNQMYHAVSAIMSMRKNGKDAAGLAGALPESGAHLFQEYTYKKITPCDVCSQVLRGHTRQGLRCRVCKMNVHVDCQDNAKSCQSKSRLLRRQKSTSEIETRVNQEPPLDEETPHSPRRHKLNLRMKSLSLDSPESTEHVQRRRHVECGPSSQSSSSHIQSHTSTSNTTHHSFPRRHRLSRNISWSTPSSPVHNRRLLSARNMRMSSVELPDDNEKSLSSASTSPCPSPKPHRLLPTNLYVVLYNFKSRHPDELDLKAGYKVTVIDTSDVDWWRGKCLGRIGFFPSKYVIRLQPGERPLQVTHNLQVSDGDNGLMLLRDQIVIQIGEELDGMVMIRSGDNRQGVCPLKFLQEV
ncbi:uncharacterized protein LOC132197273 isoform X12 [Neocloeon triangulifer]|uniref:uncharacterized protein LOC132197273 isoform X12 n=1 Tax=Neocloeon triangulifer TaxID=2078957 RepID=UPI00286F647E|nr:uncharacterized protein LOC132197273 isoform X12 [Neocloeon triangulifer]